MNEYEGNWISTLTVPHFHFLDPQPEEINIKDIAHALSLTCRFGGHCSRFYSVAEHSVRVSDYVSRESKFSALLHDAAEAYIPDIPRPIKNRLPETREMLTTIHKAILDKFDAWDADWVEIKKVDNQLLLLEAEELNVYNEDWAELCKERLDIPTDMFGWSPQWAETVFLGVYKELEDRRGRTPQV